MTATSADSLLKDPPPKTEAEARCDAALKVAREAKVWGSMVGTDHEAASGLSSALAQIINILDSGRPSGGTK